MTTRAEQLQLRKEALGLRAELERNDLAGHLRALRRPATVSYQGFKLVSLLRSPLVGLVATHLAGGSAAESPLKRAARYAGIAFALWRAARLVRSFMGR